MDSSSQAFPVGVPLPSVQLLHELPDDSRHVDWMIATDESGDSPLVTFRLPDSFDRLPLDQPIDIERIGLHRAHYLDYEGPLSGGRGFVTRLAHGEVTWSRAADGSLAAAMRWRADREEEVGEHAMTARLSPLENPDRWRLVLTGGPSPIRRE